MTNGDAIIDCVGQSGAGAVSVAAGNTITYWVSSPTDGYADFAARVQGSGRTVLSVNGATVGTIGSGQTGWTTSRGTVWLQQGVNKVVETGSSGNQVWDGIAVAPHTGTDAVTQAGATTYQAEDGVRTGITSVKSDDSNAHGAVVTDIGPSSKNALTLSVDAATTGAYVGTFRFANAQELPSNHYDPDLMVRTGWVSVNGGTPFAVAFAPTYSWNQFFTVGTNLSLKAGTNTVKIWSEQQYDWDGKTVGTVFSGDGGIGSQTRTNQAANLDDLTVAPLLAR